MSLADFQSTVDDLVRDRDNVISADQRDAAINAAVAQYSSDHPRPVVVDATAETAGTSLDLPEGWTPDSVLIAAEYPIGHIDPSMLEVSDIRVYETPSARELRLPVTLQQGEAIRLTYTADQLLDADNDTIPLRHRRAVASLASSWLCGQLASYYAGESEPTISADTVDRKTKTDRYRSLAKDLFAVYVNTVGTAPSDRVKGASAVKELRRNDSLGGRRLFHPPTNWPVS